MLTPEYLNLLEFNDVVQLYNKLNIDLTADIIDRISAMEDISVTAKNEMKILIERNGEEVFYEALEKTSMITAERKQLLKKMFSDMASEDMQGYKELYLYRDKLFKLSERQYRILNEGLRATDRLLKNLTNTIAFRTQQAYVEAIDEAYMQTVTGAYSYTNAIQNTVQKLADMGITLKDKAGRNVQLEVAVRRNVLAGIQSTANNINRDIEKELGCDGYEVTAHIGARPTHAEAQGKQYAINKEDSKKYGIGLWSDVSDLWEEYNCRHTYFGIILGISEPVYTDKELNEYKNATVEWNGKKIPYYEATQKQRQLENAIRKQKRTVQILEKAGKDTTMANAKLRTIQKKLNDFCKQTGLDKDYSRTKSTNLLNKVTKKLPLKEKNDKIKQHNIANGKNIVGEYEVTKEEKTENDGGISRIMKLQGYDGVPKIVDDDEFKNRIKESNFFAQRTYSAKTKEEVLQYQKELYEKEWYVSCFNGGAQYGRGMYCAATYDVNKSNFPTALNKISEEIQHYIDLNKQRRNPIAIIEDFTLDKSAKVIDYDKIKLEYVKEMLKKQKITDNKLFDSIEDYENTLTELGQLKQKFMMAQYVEKNQTLANEYFIMHNKKQVECEKTLNNMPNEIKKIYKETYGIDRSILAIEMGYDAINAKGHGLSGSYTVILNRTKLIIRRGGKIVE